MPRWLLAMADDVASPTPTPSVAPVDMPSGWDPFRHRTTIPSYCGPVQQSLPQPQPQLQPAPQPGWNPFAARVAIPGTTIISPSAQPAPVISEQRLISPLGWDSAFGRRKFSPIEPRQTKFPRFMYLYGMCAGSVSSSVANFAKHAIDKTATPPLTVTRASSDGAYYGTGDLDPWLIIEQWRLVDIMVVCAGAAVSQGSVGENPTLQMRLMQDNITSFTTIADVNLPCIAGPGSIGINNTASGRTGLIYFCAHSFSAPIKPMPSTFFGFQFIPQNSDNNKINAIQVASAILTFRHLGT